MPSVYLCSYNPLDLCPSPILTGLSFGPTPSEKRAPTAVPTLMHFLLRVPAPTVRAVYCSCEPYPLLAIEEFPRLNSATQLWRGPEMSISERLITYEVLYTSYCL